MKRQIYLLLVTVFFLFGCEKEAENLWTITGMVEVTDSQVPSIKSPLEGVKVYLLNAPFSIDSTKSFFAENDIVEIAETSSDGIYSFTDLVPGDYLVMPADTTVGYVFDWSESPDSIALTVGNSQKHYTINFVTPEAVAQNDEIIIGLHNYGKNDFFKKIKVFRKCRVRFGCGSWWTEPCSWYWDEMGERSVNYYSSSVGSDVLPFGYRSLSIPHDMTTPVYEYRDKFYLKFYTASTSDFGMWDYVDATHHIYTYEIPDYQYSENMSFKITWIDEEHVEVRYGR